MLTYFWPTFNGYRHQGGWRCPCPLCIGSKRRSWAALGLLIVLIAVAAYVGAMTPAAGGGG